MKQIRGLAVILAAVAGWGGLGHFVSASPLTALSSQPKLLEATPAIAGTVRDATGQPAPGVMVEFIPGIYPDAPSSAEINSDRNGNFVILLHYPSPRSGGLWGGPIFSNNFLIARDLKKNLAALTNFVEMPSAMDLVLAPGIRIAGHARDQARAPITNASASLKLIEGGRPVDLGGADYAANGVFVFTGLPQGLHYTLFVTGAGFEGVSAEVRPADSMTNDYLLPSVYLKPAGSETTTLSKF